MDPFSIDVPDAELEDLGDRVARTRFALGTPGQPWMAGTPPTVLAQLVDYWRAGFDWRAREDWLNSFPQFTSVIDGHRLHYVHVPARRDPTSPPSVAVVLLHGWPYSFVEMLPLVPYLSDPVAHGASAMDTFDVVVASLPGFVFSDPVRDAPFTSERVAALVHHLMTAELGYSRYATYGEDIGAGVSDWIAHDYPDSVIGIHATHAAYAPDDRRDNLSEAEVRFLRSLDDHWRGETGYSAIQSTKPDTLAAALSDSPAGLAAWFVEKFRTWSDCDGDLLRRFSFDDILTTVSLYWITNSIGTSFRPYVDSRHDSPVGLIQIPAGISVQTKEAGMPREFVERTYTDIRFWNDLPRGGHFTAKEEPALVAADMREFFRPLR
jgi:pimeloyl-ACP methyl ester carboxylesterase